MGFLIRSGEDAQTKAFGCRIPADLQVDLKKLRDRAKRLGFRPDTGVVVTRALAHDGRQVEQRAGRL